MAWPKIRSAAVAIPYGIERLPVMLAAGRSGLINAHGDSGVHCQGAAGRW
jgi:hypothetical protein